jgi:coenzyme F420 hydrogenase subunit beta
MVLKNKKMNTVIDVASWQLCCGCGACAGVYPEVIEMIDTLDYGRNPRIRTEVRSSVSEEAMRVCPGASLSRIAMPDGQIGSSRFYDLWGPVLGVWEGHATDQQIRFKGSSGGAATIIALYAMEKKQMAGTLHISSRQDIPFLNQTVYSHNREQLLTRAGSRYAPASPCDGFKMIEDASGPSVFIGKPCDVAAARKVMAMHSQLARKISLTIAFFCAGTPSYRGTLQMLKKMGVKDMASIRSLRYRGQGWPGNATVQYQEAGQAKTSELTYEQSWGGILQKYRQWRCYICPDHIGEYADIAVADAWHRLVADHQPGRSVIIARTAYGKEMIQQAIRDNYLEAEAVSHEILPLCRPDQGGYQGRLWARIQTLKVMRIPSPDYHGYNLLRLWRSELSIREKIQSVLSTVKRIFVKKLYKNRILSSYNSWFSSQED